MLMGQVPLTCCALGVGEGIGDSLKSLLALFFYNLMIHWISACSFITLWKSFRNITFIRVFFVSRAFFKMITLPNATLCSVVLFYKR